MVLTRSSQVHSVDEYCVRNQPASHQEPILTVQWSLQSALKSNQLSMRFECSQRPNLVCTCLMPAMMSDPYHNLESAWLDLDSIAAFALTTVVPRPALHTATRSYLQRTVRFKATSTTL